MKFWELTSVLREEKDVLMSVLGDPRWERFREWYGKLNQLVKVQDRAVLDAEVPDDLCRSVFAKSHVTYYIKDQWLRTAAPNEAVTKGCEKLTALEAYDRVGGSALEEVHEKGSFELPLIKG